jgi:large subunit ribosomal protein L20
MYGERGPEYSTPQIAEYENRKDMPRVKRGTTHTKRRRNILKQTKGYKAGRKNLIKLAQTAVLKAGQHSFRDRRKKKSDRRKVWNVQINAAARANGTKYSTLIDGLKKKNIALDRKVLAQLANENPEVFTKVVEAAK